MDRLKSELDQQTISGDSLEIKAKTELLKLLQHCCEDEVSQNLLLPVKKKPKVLNKFEPNNNFKMDLCHYRWITETKPGQGPPRVLYPGGPGWITFGDGWWREGQRQQQPLQREAK